MSSLDEDQPAPPSFLRNFSSEDSSEDTGGTCGKESDSLMDIEPHAANPNSTGARERAFDSNVRHHFADELLAGLSAATAGGGSGVSSEAGSPSGWSMRPAASSRPSSGHLKEAEMRGKKKERGPKIVNGRRS